MITKTDLPTNHRISFDHDTATNSRLRSNHHAFANVAVVSHMDHVVELRPTSDARAPERRTIHARVRANLDIIFNHHRADLRKLLITKIVSHIPKPIRTKTNTGMQYHAMAERNIVVKNNIRMQHTIITNTHVRTQHHTRFE